MVASALVASMGASEITAAFGTTRTISLYNIHSKETITVLYKKDGAYVPAAMERVNWALRDWRRDEPTKMDPALVDLLWEIHQELGSKEPIHIISGYRSRATNDMLRRTVGGQVSESRHILGKAADVHFPDVSAQKLRYAALIRERGGVGYYPTSALPFVHIDTDRVRHWPRMPRHELALLFPNGHSQHHPADGGSITPADVRVAQQRYKEIAVQVAAVQDLRRQYHEQGAVAVADAGRAARPGIQVAGLTPRADLAAPLAPPRLIDRPTLLSARPTDRERAKLTELASLAASAPPTLVREPAPAVRPRSASAALGPSLTGAAVPPVPATNRTTPAPRLAALAPRPSTIASLIDSDRAEFGLGFIQAPAFDDEHPDELSYRPFAIAPLLTATASPDDPALAHMLHPDAAKTFELLDSAGSMPPMRLRPPVQTAELLMAQQFTGNAVNFATMSDAAAPALAARRVQTTGR